MRGADTTLNKFPRARCNPGRKSANTINMHVFVSSLIALLLLGGCASTNSAEILRRRLDFARERIVSFTADVTITVASASKSRRHTDHVWVRRPDQMRFERVHPDGTPHEVVTVNGDTVATVNFETRKCGHGVLKYGFFAKVLDLATVQMDAPALVSLAFGDLTLPDDAVISHEQGLANWRWISEHEHEVMMSQDVQSGLPMRIAATGTNGAVLLDVTFANRDMQGIPELVTLYAGASEQSMEASLRNVQYNPTLDGSMFEPDLPAVCRRADAMYTLKAF